MFCILKLKKTNKSTHVLSVFRKADRCIFIDLQWSADYVEHRDAGYRKMVSTHFQNHIAKEIYETFTNKALIIPLRHTVAYDNWKLLGIKDYRLYISRYTMNSLHISRFLRFATFRFFSKNA